MNAPQSDRLTTASQLSVLVVMIIGNILMMFWPVWFAPPHVASTFWLYLGLMVLWFPLLIVLALMRKASVGTFIALLIVGVIVGIVALAFGGPNLIAGVLKPEDCT